MKDLERKVLRFAPAICERLDELAELAGNDSDQKVSRAAVVRAAVKDWLATIDNANLEKVLEAIRLSIVKRGRKPR